MCLGKAKKKQYLQYFEGLSVPIPHISLSFKNKFEDSYLRSVVNLSVKCKLSVIQVSIKG